MPKYSHKSTERLNSSHPDLQKLFNSVIKKFDNTILWGYRDKSAQDEAFKSGNSKVQFPKSKHNSLPSLAIDAAPYPIDWNDLDRFYHFAGYVRGMADILNIKIRWGGDWNGNFDLKDQNFFDLAHFELKK